MKHFNQNFFNKLQNTHFVEKTFNFFVEILKNAGVSNEVLMKFLTLFNSRLIEYFKSEDQNFKKEKYYQRFIERNLDLINLDIKMIRNYTEKLKIDEDFDTKDLILNSMSDNIASCKREIQELKADLTELKAKITQNHKLKKEITKKISKREKLKARKFFESRLKLLEEKLKNEEENRQNLEVISTKIFKVFRDTKTSPSPPTKAITINLLTK